MQRLDDFTAFVYYLRDTEIRQFANQLVKDQNQVESIVADTVAEALMHRDEFTTNKAPEELKQWMQTICRTKATLYTTLQNQNDKQNQTDDRNADKTASDADNADWDLLFDRKPRPREDAGWDWKPLQSGRIPARSHGESQTKATQSLNIKSKTSGQHSASYGKRNVTPILSKASQQFNDRSRKSRSEETDRSRQFFDDLLNNIRGQQTSTQKED